MSIKNDSAIKELMAKVDEQKNGLGKREKVAWQTNGIFKRDASNYFNLNTVTDFTLLANALGFLMAQDVSFKMACRALGIKAEFKWDGYTVSEWEEDFKNRIKAVEWDNRKKQLDETKKRLSQLVSEEARTEMELDDIKKLLEQ